jgi:hypothetical protein
MAIAACCQTRHSDLAKCSIPRKRVQTPLARQLNYVHKGLLDILISIRIRNDHSLPLDIT